jgi:hypothetical protein
MRTHLLFALLALATLLLIPGCGALSGLQYQGMDAKAIHEAVKDKNSAGTCLRITAAGSTVESLQLNNDAGVVKNGTATLKCGNLGEASFTNGEKK